MQSSIQDLRSHVFLLKELLLKLMALKNISEEFAGISTKYRVIAAKTHTCRIAGILYAIVFF